MTDYRQLLLEKTAGLDERELPDPLSFIDAKNQSNLFAWYSRYYQKKDPSVLESERSLRSCTSRARLLLDDLTLLHRNLRVLLRAKRCQ
jgi:hypothetical protein